MTDKKAVKKVTKKKVTKASSENAITVSATPEGNTADNGNVLTLSYVREGARGEFRGDFTRDTFNPMDRFSRVLMQQGRVQLDADWNEQNSIILHYLRNLACDVGSEHWGPKVGAGFEIMGSEGSGEKKLFICPGHYYVNGILCVADLDQDGNLLNYSNQSDYPLPPGESIQDIDPKIISGQVSALVYLDVWERHFTYINDDSMREVALGGPDTATRAKIIWQVKILPVPFEAIPTPTSGISQLKEKYKYFLNLIQAEIKPGKGMLCAKAKDKADDNNDPCLVAPESRYRGAENQLYRVEIHNSGTASIVGGDVNASGATFKWSRENSSVIFPITDIQDTLVSLEHLGKDYRYGLKPNDWVEVIDDDYVLQCLAEPLLQVESIDEENRQITLKSPSGSTTGTDPSKHPYLRRWDHKDGDENGIAVQENLEGELWLELEDGIQVQFKGGNEASITDVNSYTFEVSAIYQTGDYWLIPARTVTGDIEWPEDAGQPQALLPHGVVHHYAPLAILNKGQDNDGDGSDDGGDNIDLRRILIQTWV
ncbi:MAG: DUF6519 domain-containing protein [Gammaproteobacteria bacterium]|nr:DUF6519 domain-containing protein [Gammaproteobacteria bacterium]